MGTNDTTEAADHWDSLAREQDDRADYEVAIGLHAPPGPGVSHAARHRARLYRATAMAIREEQRTGLPHCTDHEGPCNRRHL